MALHASPLWVLLNGEFAVGVFFVLSGYVLTRDAFATGETGSLRRRAAGRLVRLALPASASTLGVFALLHAGAYRLQAAQALSGADAVFDSHRVFAFRWDAASLINNLVWRTWFAPADVTNMYNLVLWTMPVELWGSAIVFAAGLVLARSRLATPALVALALVLWRAVPGNGVALAIFVGGAALASIRPRPQAKEALYQTRAETFEGERGAAEAMDARETPDLHGERQSTANASIDLHRASGYLRKMGHLGLALVAVGLGLGSYNEARTLGLPHGLDAPLHGLGAVLLVAGVLHAPALQRLLAARPLVAAGKISFALYLVHQPVIYSAGAAAFVALAPAGYTLAAAVSFATVVAIALPLAIAAERWIDRPATRLANRFARTLLADRRRLTHTPQSPAAPPPFVPHPAAPGRRSAGCGNTAGPAPPARPPATSPGPGSRPR